MGLADDHAAALRYQQGEVAVVAHCGADPYCPRDTAEV